MTALSDCSCRPTAPLPWLLGHQLFRLWLGSPANGRHPPPFSGFLSELSVLSSRTYWLPYRLLCSQIPGILCYATTFLTLATDWRCPATEGFAHSAWFSIRYLGLLHSLHPFLCKTWFPIYSALGHSFWQISVLFYSSGLRFWCRRDRMSSTHLWRSESKINCQCPCQVQEETHICKFRHVVYF